jgi:hypothetical protein
MRTYMSRGCLSLLPILAACGITDVQAPALLTDEEVGEPWVETLDAAGVEAVVQAGEAEFELVLLDDGVTAGELTVRTGGAPRSERIQSRIASFDDVAGERLGLLLGDLEVSLAQETRFWVGDERVSRESFLGRVRDELSAGRNEPVIAEREAAVVPQAPDQAGFVAGDVILGGDGAPSLRMRVGRDHVERVVNPSGSAPDAWLRLLGWRLLLRIRDGTTQAEHHRHHFDRLMSFDGDVARIDLNARTLELDEGMTLRVTGRTTIVHRTGHARSLRAAAAAMEEGHNIHARGLAVAQDREGRLLGLKVALKIEEVVQEPVVMEFEGVVSGAQPGDGGTLVTLADGTTVQIRSTTALVAADEHSPGSVDGLMEALAAGRQVVVRGTGLLVQEHPLVLEGKRVVLQSEAPEAEPLDEVVGTADFVSSDGSVILIDGTAVVVTSATEVVAADANSPASVQDLIAMLDMNRRIGVRAEGTLDSAQQITAVRVVLTAQVRSFDLDAVAIDPFSGGLILEDGSFLLLTEATVITAVNGGPTDLIGIDEALASGDRVRVRGTGYLMGRVTQEPEADDHEAIAVEIERIP